MKNKIRRTIYFIFCAILFTGIFRQYSSAENNARISVQLSKSSSLKTKDLEDIFRKKLECHRNIFYTKVPRGLIISIDSLIFFEEGKDMLLPSSKPVLNIIADILNQLNNKCIIEAGTVPDSLHNSDYLSGWELSNVRAGIIVDYLIKECQVPPEKIQAIGFGEYMPFNNQTVHSQNLDRRIDFVIINYEQISPLFR